MQSMTPTECKEQAREVLGQTMSHLMDVCSAVGLDVSCRAMAQEEVRKAIKLHADACVAEALTPREPPPELADAERHLEGGNPFAHECAVIADELTRLRAEVARLESAAFRTLYVPAENAADAMNAVVGHGFKMEDATVAAKWVAAGEPVYKIGLTVLP